MRLSAHQPLVVGTLMGTLPLAAQLKRARAADVDVVELRLDTFPLPPDVRSAEGVADALVSRIKKARFPVLLTLRDARESGSVAPRSHKRSEAWRAAVIESLLPSVQAVDIELRSALLLKQILPQARTRGVDVIASHHDFHAMPSEKKLQYLLGRARRARTTYLKIAATPRSPDELRRFLMWGLKVDGVKPVLIGMGPHGQLSRVIGGFFGSVLAYGHLGRSAAPGQMSAQELVRVIRELHR